MKRLLEMRIQHLEDAMGKAPHEEETADDEEGHHTVMPAGKTPHDRNAAGRNTRLQKLFSSL